MKSNSKISAKELSIIVGISSRKLKEKNIIQRIGSAKGGYWEVKK